MYVCVIALWCQMRREYGLTLTEQRLNIIWYIMEKNQYIEYDCNYKEAKVVRKWLNEKTQQEITSDAASAFCRKFSL